MTKKTPTDLPTDNEPQDHEALLMAALKKIRDDLDWRGPTGRKQSHLALTREMAAAIYQALTGDPA